MLEKLKSAYAIWSEFLPKVPKERRYSLGGRIDALFVESIEAAAQAIFIPRHEKQPWVRLAVRKLDTLKLLLMILWEVKSLDTNKYVQLSEKLDEIGKMLGGWLGQLQKQNSPQMGEK